MIGLLDPKDEVDRLEKEVKVKESQVSAIKHIFTSYPDLKIYRPINSKDDCLMCSYRTNIYVDNFDVLEDRDSTIDTQSQVYIWPYTIIDSYKLYSNPPYFVVGSLNQDGFGVVVDPNWDVKMDAENIAASVVRKVRTYLKSRVPINYTNNGSEEAHP